MILGALLRARTMMALLLLLLLLLLTAARISTLSEAPCVDA